MNATKIMSWFALAMANYCNFFEIKCPKDSCSGRVCSKHEVCIEDGFSCPSKISEDDACSLKLKCGLFSANVTTTDGRRFEGSLNALGLPHGHGRILDSKTGKLQYEGEFSNGDKL